MKTCNVCERPLGDPIYTSDIAKSVTSLANVIPQKSTAYRCDHCGHIQSPRIDDAESYYDSEYQFYLDSDEDDQLYEVRDGTLVFRNEHQADTVLKKITLPQGAHVLDFGSAKGATIRHILARRPDIVPYVFEVSAMYEPFWHRWFDPANCAVQTFKPEWAGRFDAVVSCFTHHHVPKPVETMRELAEVLKPGGLVYFVVPNLFVNLGELLVADHPQHYTPASIKAAVALSGLQLREIDTVSHYSAFVVVAEKIDGAPASPLPSAEELAAENENAQRLAAYWSRSDAVVRNFEDADAAPAAIYGAFFYGVHIFQRLRHPERIRCFVDVNPHYHGKTVCGVPVIAPSALPDDVRRLYVATKPKVGPAAIAAIPALRDRDLDLFFLSDPFDAA